MTIKEAFAEFVVEYEYRGLHEADDWVLQRAVAVLPERHRNYPARGTHRNHDTGLAHRAAVFEPEHLTNLRQRFAAIGGIPKRSQISLTVCPWSSTNLAASILSSVLYSRLSFYVVAVLDFLNIYSLYLQCLGF